MLYYHGNDTKRSEREEVEIRADAIICARLKQHNSFFDENTSIEIILIEIYEKEFSFWQDLARFMLLLAAKLINFSIMNFLIRRDSVENIERTQTDLLADIANRLAMSLIDRN